MSNQLVKKNPAEGYQNVFPKTWIDAIKDKESGVSLQEILQGFNMYFLSYNGSRALTRCKVPSVLRKEGLWITYVLYDHTVVTEWYNSDQIDDNSWSMDSNWRVASNFLVGDVSISTDGYWVINGEKTEAKAQGEQGVTPLLRVGANNKLQVSYNAGKAWKDISDYIVPRFKWNQGVGTTAGTIQISMDLGKTWTNLSNEITNNLRISRYIGINESLPTSGVAEGTIYMKGPYYDEGDTSNTNPIYRMWIYAWKDNTLAWQDNGEFTSISATVVQERGNSTTKVMSQDSITRELTELESKVSAHFNKIEDGLIASKEHFTCESAESNKYIDYTTGVVNSFDGYFISKPIILHSNQRIITSITSGKTTAVIAKYVNGSYSGLVEGTGNIQNSAYRNISDSDISVVISGYSKGIKYGYDIETLTWEDEVKKIADLQNVTEGLQSDVEIIVPLLPKSNTIVDKYDVSGYNSGDTGYNKYITNKGEIATYESYSILGPISLNKGDLLSSIVNGSGMTFLAKVNPDESMTPIILAPQNNTTQTIEYTANDTIVVMLSSHRYEFNGYTITRKIEAASKQSVDELGAKVDSMSNIDGYNALLDREILLLTNREYYFDDSYAAEMSYINTSYLEQKIADVPKGKHFIFMTDSHIDYGRDIGKLQNETPVIKYVRDRLSIRNVIFGGDAIGVQPTKYKAAKVLSNYVNKNFEAFGSGFLFVMGNHDANPFVPSGGTIEDALISDVEVYKRTTRYMEFYGIAKYPNKLIDIINTSNDLIDDSGNTMTQIQKNEFVAWAKHNYYYDDVKQKIRYIVLETGDCGNTMRDIFGATGDAQNSLMTVAYFLVDALMNVPKNYDVVIAAHWIVLKGAFWKKVFYKVLALYKNKSSDIVNFVPNTYQHPAVQPIVEKTFDNPSTLSLTVDFTKNLGSGRIFCIDGHMHYDRATINEYVSDTENPSDDSFPLSTSKSPQSKNYSAASILHITCDRCCAIEQYISPDSNTYSYPNDISIYPDNGIARLGTIKEVLFDVVTITDDNRVVLTRFGAEGEQDGLPFVRDYVLPI